VRQDRKDINDMKDTKDIYNIASFPNRMISSVRISTSPRLRVCILLLLSALPARAAVIYSGVQDIAIPNTFDGLYLNVMTGMFTNTDPGAGPWSSDPWINLFFGGTVIGSSDHLRPVITGPDQIVNLPVGTLVDATDNFALGESGSSTHVGSGPGLFPLGQESLIGFVIGSTGGGSPLYGWMRFIIRNTGSGTVKDWAYDNTVGAAIPAGFTGTHFVPEPSRLVLLALGLLGAVTRRRRRRGMRLV
jgi:hypothetical protein